MSTISSLFAEIGFKIDTIKLREVTKLIGDLNISSIIGASSLVALGEGIKSLIDSSAAASSSLATLQANTGINTQFAQQFEAVSDALGSSKENADALITSLSAIRQNIKVGGSVPRGLALMGINYQDIMGSEEALITKINKILGQKPQLNTVAQKEAWASFLSSINKDLGASPDMLKVLTNPELFQKMKEFSYLTQKDIRANIDATYQWREAVHNVNTEFQVMLTPLLKNLAEQLKDFDTGGGFKNFLWIITKIDEGLGKMGDLSGIASNYLHVVTNPLEAENAAAARRMEARYSKQREQIARLTTVNVAPITIHANDPYEFVKKFDDHFKKYMTLTSSQFSLGQT